MTLAILDAPTHPILNALRIAQTLLTQRIQFTNESLAEHLRERRWSQLPGYEHMARTLEECRHAFVKAELDVELLGPARAARKLIRYFENETDKSDNKRALALAQKRWTDVVQHDAEGTAYILAKRLAEDETKPFMNR